MPRPAIHPPATQLGPAFDAVAVLVGERIDVRGLERVDEQPPLLAAGAGVAAVFRYGAVVFFGADDAARAAFLAELAPRIAGRYSEPDREVARVRVDPRGREGMANDDVQIARATPDRLLVVAEILAKSVVLAHYEDEIADAFQLVEPLAEQLERGALGRGRTRTLLSHIGRILRIQHRMVGRVEVLEKPELLWEHPELERLYARLEDEYELRERHSALERKLDLIAATASTVLELLQARRSLRVEWYIVILIVIEIVLILYFDVLR
ncbi:MAG: RMD1 family protein [Deltaproteobacteria bacterium]|nr:MAG: RMD1 family protein [Deltaproteobacteria bacterium]